MSSFCVMPVKEDILKTMKDPSRVIALYGDDEFALNVGYPAIAAYKPIFGNMWGYNEASIKDIYIKVDRKDTSIEEKYDVIIDDSRNIVISKVKVNNEEIEKENNEQSSIVTFEEIKTRQKKRAR